MRILITPAAAGERIRFYEHLVKLETWSREKKHVLTHDPAEADIILVTDGIEDDDFHSLRFNPILKKYPNKAFTIYEGDFPRRYVPGIYTSMPKSFLNFNRFRPGTYSKLRIACGSALDHKPAMPRTGELFFSFVGRASHPVRERLFKTDFRRDDVVVKDSSAFDYFQKNSPDCPHFQSYLEICMKSRFVLCPRGKGTSSLRLFEVMEMGLAPVVISDKWMPPVGPKWEDFTVFVRENQIQQLPEILSKYEDQWRERGDLARKNWEQWFQIADEFNYLVDRLVEIKQSRRIDERLVRLAWPFMVAEFHIRRQFLQIKTTVKKSLQRWKRSRHELAYR